MAPVVQDTGWFTSSFSSSGDEACVEVRITDRQVGVRDSKNVSGPAFGFAPGEWRAFVAVTKTGRFDG